MKIFYTSLITLTVLPAFLSKGFSQCTPRVLPFTETFSGAPFSACAPTTGGWTGTSAASGAGWWIPSPATNYAGGTAPEVEAYGDQANGGISETIHLTSPPLNVVSTSSVTLSFKHNLYLENSAASGPNTISINVETSPDTVNWTSVYMNGWGATSSLTSVVTETRTVTISGLSSNTLYVRFSISGVMFKVWGWEIDDVNVTTGTASSVPEVNQGDVKIYPNPVLETLNINTPSIKQSHIILYDLTGKIIYQTQMNSDQLSIDLKAFPKGLYFLQLQNENGVLTRKISKE